ncbi:MAG: LPS export ABC transporter ATP-binding protein [Chitinophagales bacterium]
MSIVIHTKNLVKKYSGRSVVNHVSVDVKQGEIVGLLGPNGAGKTTTFYMVVGLIKPDEGEVYLDDQNITKLPMYKRAKMGIGYLPQEASVFRKLSVEDNIAAVLEMTNLPKREQKDKLESLLDEFRLQHVRKSNGDVLSGGERRRTEIARALAVDPKFILLDEPFAGIDPIAVEDIQATVAKMKYKNIGILITDHNVTETLSICDRAYLLIEGKIFAHGAAEELAANEQVRKLYLGRNFELKRKDYLHDEARGHSREILVGDYFSGLIDTIGSILNERMEKRVDKSSFQTLKDPVLFKEFCSDYYNVVDAIEQSPLFAQEKKLQQYTAELRDIKIEDQFHLAFWQSIYNAAGDLTSDHSNDVTDHAFTEYIVKSQAFAALEKAKQLFEKCKLIIHTAEVGNVLS